MKSNLLKSLLSLAAVLAVVGSVGCAAHSSAPADPPQPCIGTACGVGACTVGNDQYRDGTSRIPASDGCNTCSCNDGALACTEMGCGSGGNGSGGSANGSAGSGGTANSCNVGGTIYPDGAVSIAAPDGCNTCNCAGGELACTQIGCASTSCTYAGTLYSDGATFDAIDGCNTCTCTDGAVACTEIGCPPLGAACTEHGQCELGEICKTAVGVCGGAGNCEATPENCDLSYVPVCGCDGQTYGNECSARAFGVGISAAGECVTGPTTCGGVECTDTQFCKYSAGTCGGLDGVCTDLPSLCLDDYVPVCGCDGQTYGNACGADSAGVSVAYLGECSVVCVANDGCGVNEYCMFPLGLCGSTGLVPTPANAGAAVPQQDIALIALPSGSCAPRSEACPAIFAPVCGCDGMTYGNACNAGSAGVSVLSEGECPAVP